MYKFNFDAVPPQGDSTGCLIFPFRDIDKFDAAIATSSAMELLFGDSAKYMTRLYLTPINIFNYVDGEEKPIYVQNERINVSKNAIGTDNYYFYCGTYKRTSFDYTDYEPYTTCNCLLPYYGLIDIPMKYINKYYITFILCFSPQTGNASYIITADSASPMYNNTESSTKLRAHLDNYTLYTEFIIKRVTFNIAMDVPITNTGMTDMLRNFIMSAGSAAVNVGGAIATFATGVPVSAITSTITGLKGTTTMTERTRNPFSGRVVKSKEQTTEHDPDISVRKSERYENVNYEVLGSITNGISNAIHCIGANPQIEKVSNPFLQICDDYAIHIYITKQKVKYISNNLLPKPCFSSGELNQAFDITEIGINHFNNYNKYNSPKSVEIENIKTSFKGLIICRPNINTNVVILGDNIKYDIDYSKPIMESLNTVEDVINNNGLININGYGIFHNHIPVRYDDFPSTKKYFIANLPLGQDTFNLSFDFCNNIITDILPNTYWEDILNTNNITLVDGYIHINAKFNNVSNIDIPIIYNSTNSSVEEKDMIIPSENKTTYSSNVRAFKLITEDGDKLFYFGDVTTWGEFIQHPTYNVETNLAGKPFSVENSLVLYKGNALVINGLPVKSGSNIYLYENPYTID